MSTETIEIFTLAEAQETLRGITDRLREVDAQLTGLSSFLPAPCAESFEPRAELRGLVDCVRKDLLEDAIRTLQTAGSCTEPAFRLEHVKRQERWLEGGA